MEPAKEQKVFVFINRIFTQTFTVTTHRLNRSFSSDVIQLERLRLQWTHNQLPASVVKKLF